MRKRILVDMDGVLADTYAKLHRLFREETGSEMAVEATLGKLEEEAFPKQRRWVASPGFFRDVPIMEGSREVLEKMNKVYEIIIISLATEFPNSLTDKQLWIMENFPFISWKQIVFCGNKSLISADIMIDDHPKNLDGFGGVTYIFTQPNNVYYSNPKHIRIGSWKEIQSALL